MRRQKKTPDHKKQRQPIERHCRFCGECFPKDGPLPYECDWHIEGGVWFLSCGPSCREKAGIQERKAVY